MLKPLYHFRPDKGWINDPNGLIQFDGTYHLFYQYNPVNASPPYGPSNPKVHWGHAISDDLVFWKHLPIALYPDKEGPDKDGCWSGCAVNNNGILTLIYTGFSPECVCIAESSDGIKFKKYSKNPVISGPPENQKVAGFRDPYVWKEGNLWYLILGSGIENKRGMIFLYRSKNIYEWEYTGTLLEGDINYGYMWECPNFFKIEDKYVLIVSPIPVGYPIYFIGEFKDNKFKVENIGKVDLYPSSFYAPQVFKNDNGRTIMFGWLREMCEKEFFEKRGWAGVISLPRLLYIENNRLCSKPISEIEKLRSDLLLDFESIEITEKKVYTLKNNTNYAFEIETLLNLKNTDGFTISLLESESKDEKTVIGYNRKKSEFFIDTTKSSLYNSVRKSVVKEKVEIPETDIFLDIFVDQSVVEIFINNKFSFSFRVYPSKNNNFNITFSPDGGTLKIKKVKCWKYSRA